MSRRFTQIKKLGICLAAIALPLVVGCGGVSQEEMAALEQRLTTEASEQKVSSLQAEKARLERKLAEKKATKKALEQKLAATKKNLAN
jgi:predicted RNase H-like nuclease (RuvC/YqgF family)